MSWRAYYYLFITFLMFWYFIDEVQVHLENRRIERLNAAKAYCHQTAGESDCHTYVPFLQG